MPDEAPSAEHNIGLASFVSSRFRAEARKLAHAAARPLKFKALCFEFEKENGRSGYAASRLLVAGEAEWNEFRLTRSRKATKVGAIPAGRL